MLSLFRSLNYCGLADMRHTDPLRFRLTQGKARGYLRTFSLFTHFQVVKIDRETCFRITRNQAKENI